MTAITKMRCIFPLRDGLTEVECWANSADAEIVVHPFLSWGEVQQDRWMLTHRRSGKSVSTISFLNKESALCAAAELDRIDDFKRVTVDRLEEGPTNDFRFMGALRDQVSAALDEFCARTAVEPRPEKLAPQQAQRGEQ